ncbi:MAG: futalosine hydrolase [Saprospiraceae bacterium]|nr:futalosine hydrolase [Saprospiraceae bacterium]
MQIGLISATELELAPLLQMLEVHWLMPRLDSYQRGPHTIFPLVTGVGSTSMAFALARFAASKSLDLAVHLSVSGSFRSDLINGSLVEVTSECWGDLGAEDGEGGMLDVFELGLQDAGRQPFNDGRIAKKKATPPTRLPAVHGVTVQCVTGTHRRRALLEDKYGADVESMEGMGFFYAARMLDLPFVSLRCISNQVGPRDKSKWDLDVAVSALCRHANDYLMQVAPL